ncbi:MAG: DUF4399 domain-containing protein [bacterium]
MMVVISVVFSSLTLTAQAHTPPDHAKVYFKNIKDRDPVSSPVKIEFGLEGFGITPAGNKGKIRHKAGHHHLIINEANLPDLDEPIPVTPHHLYYDKVETSAELVLPPGKHTLQLLLGAEEHKPQDPPLMSERITITVE